VFFEYSLNREGLNIFRPLWTDIPGTDGWMKKPSWGTYFRWSEERPLSANPRPLIHFEYA
jgi:hypothetical protein